MLRACSCHCSFSKSQHSLLRLYSTLYAEERIVMKQAVLTGDIFFSVKDEFLGSFSVDPLDGWTPDDSYNIEIDVDLDIGIQGERGACIYRVKVVTPSHMLSEEEYEQLPKWEARGRLLIPYWDWPKVRATLEETVASCRGRTADDAMAMVRGFFKWEYDGMYAGAIPFRRKSG